MDTPIDAQTRYCAVLGYPVKHSASPAMHNAALGALGLNWKYLAFEVAPAQLGSAIEAARTLRFIGLNLTVPHKVAALAWVDLIEESAKLWGAINTVAFEVKNNQGAWVSAGTVAPEHIQELRAHGYNTDAPAISASVQEDLGLSIPGLRAIVLGAGGAARVAALKLAAEGAGEIYLVNRTPEKAREIADDIGRHYPRVHATCGYPTDPVDLLINATSLGLAPADPLPCDPAAYPLHHAACVYDMIYRPAETPLLKLAKAAGCKVANGLGMLWRQGARALEIWTGQTAPAPSMRQALERNIYA